MSTTGKQDFRSSNHSGHQKSNVVGSNVTPNDAGGSESPQFGQFNANDPGLINTLRNRSIQEDQIIASAPHARGIDERGPVKNKTIVNKSVVNMEPVDIGVGTEASEKES